MVGRSLSGVLRRWLPLPLHLLLGVEQMSSASMLRLSWSGKSISMLRIPSSAVSWNLVHLLFASCNLLRFLMRLA
eukprot:4501995-Pyramimonas_sp.AAC.1